MQAPRAWPAIKREFDENGFVRIPGFVSSQKAQEAAARLDCFIREILPNIPTEEVFYEIDGDADTIKSITSLAKHDPFFRNLYAGAPFLEAAAALLGGPAKSTSVHLLNKPARVGTPTRPHQDAAYLPRVTPGSSLTIWLCLEPADADNGAMIYLRGSHRDGLRPHRNNGNRYFSYELAAYEDYNAPEEVTAEAQPGDALIHHALTIHRTEDNQSEHSRNALIADFILEDSLAEPSK